MMGEIERRFKRVTGFSPYDFQREAVENLLEGYSLIVRAPTGAGKSEMVLIPFISEVNESLPSQLIYSLPNRTLVESLGNRAKRYASFKKLRVAVHHGKRVESQLFEEDIIITTIDQATGAYLSVPLSMPKKWGNIFVGGVASSMLVFDEVHTLHPEKGLLTSVAMSVESSKLGFPFVMMSATLPESFMEKVKNMTEKKKGKVHIINVDDENEITSRKTRRVYLDSTPLYSKTSLTAEEVLRHLEDSKNLLIVVNTVSKAQKLYLDLKDRVDIPLLLLHSRFLEEDRQAKERAVLEIFGKKQREGILIATQVVEVGMDISSSKLLTEISPIDSLIQRAGRVARWGGEGEVILYDVERTQGNAYSPYTKDLVESTIGALKGVELLNWQAEVMLVDKVLSKPFENYLDPYKFYERLGGLVRAVYEGKRAYVEENVREAYSVEIALYENVEELKGEPEKAFALKRLRVDFRVLAGKFNYLQEIGAKIYRVEENPLIDEYESKYELVEVQSKEDIMPFEFYIISGISYSPEVGLLFDKSSEIKSFELEEKDHMSKLEIKELKRETWVEHSLKTLDFLRTYMLPRYAYPIKTFAKYFDISKKDLVSWIELSVALHDLGKLNYYWQKAAGWQKGEEPIAHGFEKVKRLPPHATVSAKALEPYLMEQFDEEGLFKAFYLAIAHHHSPWSSKYQKFKLIKEAQEYISSICSIPDDLILRKSPSGSFPFKLNIDDENEYYRLYGLVSKLLRISDRLATGGESYESIFGS